MEKLGYHFLMGVGMQRESRKVPPFWRTLRTVEGHTTAFYFMSDLNSYGVLQCSCNFRFSSRVRRKTDFFSLVGEGEEGEERDGKGKTRSKKVPSNSLSVVRKLSFEPHSKPALVAPPPDVLTTQNNSGLIEEDGGPVAIMESPVCKEDIINHAVVCPYISLSECVDLCFSSS